MAVNPNTLAAISGKSTLETAQGFAQQMQSMAALREEQSMNEQKKTLMGLQQSGAKLQQEQAKYDMAQTKIADETEKANTLIAKKYRSAYKSLPEDATAQQHAAKAVEAQSNNAPAIAKHHFEMAQELGKAGAKGPSTKGKTKFGKWKIEREQALKNKDYKTAEQYDALLKQELINQKITKVDSKAVNAVAGNLISQIGADDAAGFGDAVSNQINTAIDAMRTKNVALDSGKIMAAITSEAKKGDSASFVTSSWGNDTIDYAQLNSFVQGEINKQIPGATWQDDTYMYRNVDGTIQKKKIK